MKIRILMFLLLLGANLKLLAQEGQGRADSIVVPVQLMVNLPKLFNLSYSQYAPVEQKFVSRDGQSFNYQLNSTQVLSASLRYPLLHKSKSTRLFLDGQYNYFNMPGASLTGESFPNEYPAPDHTSYARMSLLGFQPLRIGKRNLLVVVQASMVGLQFWSLDQFTGLLSLSYPLRSLANSSFALGLTILFPGSDYPYRVIPSIAYAKRLNYRLVFDLYFPLHLQMQYWANDGFVIKSGAKGVQFGNQRFQDVGYSSLDIDVFQPKFALFGSVEKRLSGLVWMSAELGYEAKLSSKVVEHGSDIEDYIYESSSYGSFYGSISLFLRPSFKDVLKRNR